MCETREELCDAVRDLRAVRTRLRGITIFLPAHPRRAKDREALARSSIECVLADSLEPAIRDLDATARLWREGGLGVLEDVE